MSDYRPWDPPKQGVGKPAGVQDAAGAGDGASQQDAPPAQKHAPWHGSLVAAGPGAGPTGFEAPPGLAGAAPARAGARGMRMAGALLLCMGGFLVFGGIAGAAWSGGIATFMEASGEGHDPGSVRSARTLQYVCLGLLFLAGVPAAVAGIGVLYRQPWAHGLGIAAASLHLLIIPVGTGLGIIALSLLTRRPARWWFQ